MNRDSGLRPIRKDSFKGGVSAGFVGFEGRRRVELWRDPGAVVHRPGALPVQVGDAADHFAVWKRKPHRFSHEVRARPGRLADEDGFGIALDESRGVLSRGERLPSDHYEQLPRLVYL